MASVPNLSVGLAQLNLSVGDLDANADAIIDAYRGATASGAQLVVFSELAVTGYPPEDLLLKPAFLRAGVAALDRIAAVTGDAAAVVGFPEPAGGAGGGDLGVGGPEVGGSGTGSGVGGSGTGARVVYNAAAVCAKGKIQAVFRKRQLPNYAVFDEQRYFTGATGEPIPLVDMAGVSVGVSICEDIWDSGVSGLDCLGGFSRASGLDRSDGSSRERLAPVLAEQVAAGAELLVCINGSPYRRGKQAEREQQVTTQARLAGVPLVYVNQVGGQDELVFDGGSCVSDANGELVARLRAFEPAVVVVPVPVASIQSVGQTSIQPAGQTSSQPAGLLAHWPEPLAEIWQALATATSDYVTKNGFTDVAVGTSGGVDSSLVTALAVDALGPEHVHAVAMPSRYSSEHSVDDAMCLAANLGIDFHRISIEPAHCALAEMMAFPAEPAAAEAQTSLDVKDKPSLAADGSSPATADVDLAEQNLQSRIRGVILMTLSNRHGWLILTTGNKTELSVGYSTLYGDSAGGYAVIKDCPKLLVYELCRWRNAQTDDPWIPVSTLTKPPSAELSPGQRDSDHLPPYELLDPLVEGYVDGDMTTEELIERAAELGADAELVRRITRLVDLAEFKRRQSPLGPRISAKSFGKDRRMPVTNAYR